MLDLPPEAPSFIMRVCSFGFHNLWFCFGQGHCRQWFATQTMRGRFSGRFVPE
jgi:hypothetical protein